MINVSVRHLLYRSISGTTGLPPSRPGGGDTLSHWRRFSHCIDEADCESERGKREQGTGLLPDRPVRIFIPVVRCSMEIKENITCVDWRRAVRKKYPVQWLWQAYNHEPEFRHKDTSRKKQGNSGNCINNLNIFPWFQTLKYRVFLVNIVTILLSGTDRPQHSGTPNVI